LRFQFKRAQPPSLVFAPLIFSPSVLPGSTSLQILCMNRQFALFHL
jgi:hypothetical protein